MEKQPPVSEKRVNLDQAPTRSPSLSHGLDARVQALEFIGEIPAAIVPDNLKSGVKRAHRYEPEINPSYQDFAEQYSIAILPARVRKRRNKACAC